MDLLRWIIISVICAGLIIFFSITLLLKRYHVDKNNNVNIDSKILCKVKECESWYRISKNDSIYCGFHNLINHLHKDLEKLNSPSKNKARMYMSINAKFYSSKTQQENIVKDLQKARKKAQNKISE